MCKQISVKLTAMLSAFVSFGSGFSTICDSREYETDWNKWHEGFGAKLGSTNAINNCSANNEQYNAP